MNNGQTKPAYNLQIATENQYWTNFTATYPNPTDTLTFKPFLDKYKKRYGKQSKSVTADSGYGSEEENYEYLEMEEMMGYVKYNWFHKEQHKPFKEDASTKQTLTTTGMMTIMSAPWDNTWNLVDNGKRKVIPAMCLSLHYIEHNDVMDVHLEVSARNPKATEPYMSTIN